MGSLKANELPVIEFTNDKMKHGTTSWSKACKEVISALEEYGCFVASYDKITLELNDGVFHELEELFNLPIETKVQNKSTKPLYGYIGQNPFYPLYESLGIDEANTLDGVQRFAKVMWPNGNDAFSEKLLQYAKLAAELEQIVVRMVFESYGMEKYFESHIKSANYLCRVMKYREAKTNESKMGLYPHTDKSFMSTLHQNQVNGLEMKAKDGEWFCAELSSPSSIVVLAGDAIMAWSNDRIKSPMHRVTTEGKEVRYSLVQFSVTEGIVQTPQELIDEEHPLRYKPFHPLEYLDFCSKEENRTLESSLRTYCGI